ncbi:MAG: DNA recombination protein RmuC, partial [Thermodesulfovibrionales bacterium]
DYIDFVEQKAINTEDGRYQPDVIVRLPNGRAIVIDAKAPVDSFLNATSAKDETDKKKALDQYVSQIRNHIKSLSSKSYWEKVKDSTEMIVMFLPAESFYSAAIEHDPKLIEDSAKERIIIATPTTLIGLLKVVAYGWQQKQITENALRVSELGRELHDRLVNIIEHIDKLGKNLNLAVKSYNDSISSIQTRLMPKIKQIRECGIVSQKEIPMINSIDIKCRENDIITDNPETKKENFT